jgi:hypothetical protein
MYKVTLDIYVSQQVTHPVIVVESYKGLHDGRVKSTPAPADTEALECVLTATREFAESILRGVTVER